MTATPRTYYEICCNRCAATISGSESQGLTAFRRELSKRGWTTGVGDGPRASRQDFCPDDKPQDLPQPGEKLGQATPGDTAVPGAGPGQPDAQPETAEREGRALHGLNHAHSDLRRAETAHAVPPPAQPGLPRPAPVEPSPPEAPGDPIGPGQLSRVRAQAAAKAGSDAGAAPGPGRHAKPKGGRGEPAPQPFLPLGCDTPTRWHAERAARAARLSWWRRAAIRLAGSLVGWLRRRSQRKDVPRPGPPTQESAEHARDTGQGRSAWVPARRVIRVPVSGWVDVGGAPKEAA